MNKEWLDLKDWAEHNNQLYIVKMMLDNGGSREEIIEELNINENIYLEIIETLKKGL